MTWAYNTKTHRWEALSHGWRALARRAPNGTGHDWEAAIEAVSGDARHVARSCSRAATRRGRGVSRRSPASALGVRAARRTLPPRSKLMSPAVVRSRLLVLHTARPAGSLSINLLPCEP